MVQRDWGWWWVDEFKVQKFKWDQSYGAWSFGLGKELGVGPWNCYKKGEEDYAVLEEMLEEMLADLCKEESLESDGNGYFLRLVVSATCCLCKNL